jgi:phosphate transport system substrate-binding protein
MPRVHWIRFVASLSAMGLIMAFLASPSAVRAQEATPSGSTPAAPAVDLAQLSGRIIADGSSTVEPFTAEAGFRFDELSNATVEVEVSGTGGGFRRFCAGESDLQNASRPINADEEAACQASGVAYDVFPVAIDGITVTVNPQNTWAQCLTVDQLRALWAPESAVRSWRDLDPSWPDAEIELYGPGPDSGTFDYFTEAIVGEAGDSRTDYIPSENDLDLVEGVASQPNALGYFGFTYYEADADRLRPLAIDAGDGCIAPTSQTIADGTYTPLSRELYLYVNRASLARPEVREFLRFLVDNSADVAATVGYVPLPTEAYAENHARLETLFAAAGAAVPQS